MSPTTPTADLSDRDNKETLLVKEEETNGAEVFGEKSQWTWRDHMRELALLGLGSASAEAAGLPNISLHVSIVACPTSSCPKGQDIWRRANGKPKPDAYM